VPTYDDDGNLLSDGRFTYEWDGENRLVKAEMIEAPDPYQAGPFWVYPPKLRVSYSYDYMGRRVRTFVEKNELFMGGVPVWETESDTRYVYDGWNVVLELDGEDSNAIVMKYTWGLDISGSLQGAGGVGGLLACEDLKDVTDANDDVTYVYVYDGNGNVMALTDSSYDSGSSSYPGTEVARYDYDPYGNVLTATGAEADANRYRFSTKPQDAVTELFYYGYRWYHADWGRWISRDPIGERGGLNKNGFTSNSPIGFFDILGLTNYVFGPAPLPATPTNTGGSGVHGADREKSSDKHRNLISTLLLGAGGFRAIGYNDAARRYNRISLMAS